jgi:hypothetical protein
MNWSGLIPLIGGIYGYLLATGYLPKNPKDPEKMELWRKKFGGMMKILGPIVAISGVLEIFGILHNY